MPVRSSAFCVAVIIIAASWLAIDRSNSGIFGPLPSEAYVWQRDWTPAVRFAVANADPSINRLDVLIAEVNWRGDRPRVTRVAVHFASLASRPYGVVLRINAVDPTQIPPATIAILAAGELHRLPIPAAELQLDFDCPESKLAAYAGWLAAAQAACRPTTVTITALPAWLKRSDFSLLARRCNYVLQVHSLHRPATIGGDWSLFDPAEARRAVETAGRLGSPFRVALPTYGCVAVFDPAGRFLRIYSENLLELPNSPLQTKWLRSDPTQIATLVRDWRQNHPAALTGLIWYRLPVDGDTLNWRPATLAAVMNGRTPSPLISVIAHRNADGVTDIALTNTGDADAPLPAQIELDWTAARLIAADALGGYQKLDDSAGSLTLAMNQADDSPNLAPGDRRAIGWLRLTKDTEVRGHVITNP